MIVRKMGVFLDSLLTFLLTQEEAGATRKTKQSQKSSRRVMRSWTMGFWDLELSVDCSQISRMLQAFIASRKSPWSSSNSS